MILFLKLLIGFLVITALVEVLLRPRLDKLTNGETIIWYGIMNRKYFILY